MRGTQTHTRGPNQPEEHSPAPVDRDDIEAPQPPYWHPGERAWIVTRYADVLEVLKSRDARAMEAESELGKLSGRVGDFPNLRFIFSGMLIFQSPPRHTELKAKIRAFLDDVSGCWSEAAVEAQVDELVSRLDEGHCDDVNAALADALPGAVMARALGLDLADVRWLRTEGVLLTGAWRRPVAVRDYPPLEESAGRVRRFLATNESARAVPGGESTLFFLLMAGVETTAAFLGNAIHLLSEAPDIQDALRADPSRVHDFIEEALRFCGPLKRLSPRLFSREQVLGGIALPAGAVVTVKPSSANRDPTVYAEPNRFDLNRQGPPAIAFSAGPHACMGAALARLEAKALLGRLVKEFAIGPGRNPARRRASVEFHRFDGLEVTLTRRRPS